MTKQKNKYKRHARISESEIRKILKAFSLDMTATLASKQLGITRKTINNHYVLFRKLIYDNLKPSFSGTTFELDETYYGAKRVKGKRGRGAGNKTAVFGVVCREDGNVYTEIVSDCSQDTLLPIIQQRVPSGSCVYTDGWLGYTNLRNIGYTHMTVNHGSGEYVRGEAHTNTIESYWSFSKRRLGKFSGVPSSFFNYHLKECEFRWINRQHDIYPLLLSLLRKSSR